MDNVLLVEDTAERLERMKRIAAGVGRSIVPAKNLAEALELLDREEFDLVVTDLALTNDQNDKGGLEVLSAARKRDADLPTILVTSYASPLVAHQAIALNVFDVIDRSNTRFDDNEMLGHKIDLALRYRKALRGLHLTPA